MSKEQVGFRLEAEQVERLERLAEALTKRAAGVTVNRSMAARTALERGLAVMEEEVGLIDQKGSKAAKKASKK